MNQQSRWVIHAVLWGGTLLAYYLFESAVPLLLVSWAEFVGSVLAAIFNVRKETF